MSLARILRTAGVVAASSTVALAAATAPANAATGVTLHGTATATMVAKTPANVRAYTARVSSVAHMSTAGATVHSIPSRWVGCSGTLVTSVTVRDKLKRPVGELDVYYRTSYKGTVIACYKHVGTSKGITLPTAVTLAACDDDTCTKPEAMTTAAGRFRSWAGPAAVAGVQGGACVVAVGIMDTGRSLALAKTPVICGN